MFAEFGSVPKDAVWFLYLALKSFSVSLMYVSEVFLPYV